MKVQNCTEIPEKLGSQEILVRAILTPLHYSQSRQRLKETAFLPPPRPNRNDVSVFRLDYSSDSECKKIAISRINIPNNTYLGFAVVNVDELESLSNPEWCFPDQEGIGKNFANKPVEVKVIASPLTKEDELSNKRPICKEDLGTPFHADIIYPGFKPKSNVRIPNAMKKFAKHIATKISRFYLDPDLNHSNWTGNRLK